MAMLNFQGVYIYVYIYTRLRLYFPAVSCHPGFVKYYTGEYYIGILTCTSDRCSLHEKMLLVGSMIRVYSVAQGPWKNL